MPITKRRRMTTAFTEILLKYGTPADKIDPLIGELLNAVWPAGDENLHARMMGALAEAMQIDLSLNGGRLGKFATTLLNAHYAPEQVMRYYNTDDSASPWRKDWRGRKGSAPNERDIAMTIAQFARWEANKNKPLEIL